MIVAVTVFMLLTLVYVWVTIALKHSPYITAFNAFVAGMCFAMVLGRLMN